MSVHLPTNNQPLLLDAGYLINASQRQLLVHYNVVDPGCELIGFHRSRPVIWTFLFRPRSRGYETAPADLLKRHVVVIQRNGCPGDLPSTWEDDWRYASSLPLPKRQRVRAIIEDWFSWSTRA